MGHKLLKELEKDKKATGHWTTWSNILKGFDVECTRTYMIVPGYLTFFRVSSVQDPGSFQ